MDGENQELPQSAETENEFVVHPVDHKSHMNAEKQEPPPIVESNSLVEEPESIDETVELCSPKVKENIATLYLTQKFSDVTFILNGQQVHTHKVILAMSSTYFENLLFGNLEQESQKEITLNAPIKAFKKLLQFVYTDRTTISTKNLNLTLEVLDLAKQFSIEDLLVLISKKLMEIINDGNLFPIIKRASEHKLEELFKCCLNFIDEHAWDFLKHEEFKNLPEKILIQVLERNTFKLPEIEIFKAIDNYYNINGRTTDGLLGCVRLSLMSTTEIYDIVTPTRLFKDNVLMAAIGEIIGQIPKTSIPRIVSLSLINANVASTSRQAEVLNPKNETDFTFVLDESTSHDRFSSWSIGKTDSFAIKLKTSTYVNNIKILFPTDAGQSSYRYYIESSVDGETWKTLIDYRIYDCRAAQELYFKTEFLQFVRITGTYSSVGTTMDIASLQVYYRNVIPKLVNGIICPFSNVALLNQHAVLVQGINDSILIGDINSTKDTYCRIGHGNIIIQLAQPYIVDTIRLRLHDKDQRCYKYYVETSINKSDWTVIADRRNVECRSWQDLNFVAQPVVYIRITGTFATIGSSLGCHYIECLASDGLIKSDT